MSENNQTYTVEKIKQAFWKTFHAQGEIWFNYIEPGDNEYWATPEESTNGHWEEFCENLTGISRFEGDK